MKSWEVSRPDSWVHINYDMRGKQISWSSDQESGLDRLTQEFKRSSGAQKFPGHDVGHKRVVDTSHAQSPASSEDLKQLGSSHGSRMPMCRNDAV